MEFTGIIKDVLEEKSGKGKNGTWKAQSFVIVEERDQYPNSLLFEVFGEEKLKQFDLKKEDRVTISFNPKVTEWNGRYFNQIRAYKCERAEANQTTTAPEKTQQSANDNKLAFAEDEPSKDAGSDTESSELPF